MKAGSPPRPVLGEHAVCLNPHPPQLKCLYLHLKSLPYSSQLSLDARIKHIPMFSITRELNDYVQEVSSCEYLKTGRMCITFLLNTDKKLAGYCQTKQSLKTETLGVSTIVLISNMILSVIPTLKHCELEITSARRWQIYQPQQTREGLRQTGSPMLTHRGTGVNSNQKLCQGLKTFGRLVTINIRDWGFANPAYCRGLTLAGSSHRGTGYIENNPPLPRAEFGRLVTPRDGVSNPASAECAEFGQCYAPRDGVSNPASAKGWVWPAHVGVT